MKRSTKPENPFVRPKDLILAPDPRVVVAAKLPPPNYGVLMYDHMEDLDLAGPWEVFSCAVARAGGRIFSVAESADPVRGARGLRFLPDYTFVNAPHIDILVVPGGAAPTNNPAVVSWVREVGARCRWVTSVCTGAFLLHSAGFLRGKRATTYWGSIMSLRALGDVTVVEDVRYVRDGKVVTSAGVSAGIDMALWLVGRVHSPAFARDVQKYMEYYPKPPYAT
jgi:transcriptional regulator GlxA family with amidase domain